MKNIPKICHLTWTKGSVMSLLQTFTVVSFHKYNPDWRIIVHLVQKSIAEIGKNTYVPDYSGKDYFHLIEKMSYVEIDEVNLSEMGITYEDKASMQISDILRIRYLYEVGGVYSDFDMIWLKPMSKFSKIKCTGNPDDFETTACFFEYTRGHHNNSNIVSEPHGKYLASIIEAQNTLLPPYSHQAFNTDLLQSLYPTFYYIASDYPRVIAIHYNTFYPYSIYALSDLYAANDLKPIMKEGVIGLHWFNGHSLSQAYVAMKNFKKKCSMTTILIKEGLI